MDTIYDESGIVVGEASPLVDVAEVERIRAKMRQLADEQGFRRECDANGWDGFPPGKFECEPEEVVYWWAAALRGDSEPMYAGELFEADSFAVSEEERAAFNLTPAITTARLSYGDRGFVSLDYLTADGWEAYETEVAAFNDAT